MKRNESGFSAVMVLVMLVILGAIGAAGWMVFGREETTKEEQTTVADSSKSSQEEQSDASAPENKEAYQCAASFKEIKNEKMGISFCHPESWSAKLSDTPASYVVGEVTLTSPDYEEVEGGFGGSSTGSKVYIGVFDNNLIDRPTIKNILDGTEESKQVYSEVSAVKIAGKDGATFISAYEGPRLLSHEFEHKGRVYSIFLEEDLDAPSNFNDGKELYLEIIKSFRLLNE